MKVFWKKLTLGFKFLELVYGLLAAFMVAFATPIVCFLFWLGTVMSPVEDRVISPLLLLSGFVVSAIAAYLTVQFLAAALEPELTDFNLDPAEAWGIRLGRHAVETPWWKVVPMVLPWLAYYVMAGVGGHYVHRWISLAADRPNPGVAVAMGAAFVLAFTVAMHAYLILALAGLFRSIAIVRAVWNWRFVIDVVLTLAIQLTLAVAR